MKRNHTMLFIGAALIALLMGSCDTLFTNQFQTLGLGQVSLQMITDAVTNGDANAIIGDSGITGGEVSPSFLAAATANPQTAADVKQLLQETIDSGTATPETVQAAEILIIEIDLELTGGNNFIDNITSAMGSIDFNSFSFSSGDPSDLNALLAALFPPKGSKALPVGYTDTEIALMIDTIRTMGEVGNTLDNLIASLQSNGYLVQGISAGRIAEIGIIATALQSIEPATLSEYTTTGAALTALIVALSDGTPADPTSYIQGVLGASLDDLMITIVNDPKVISLCSAAGWDLAALMAQFRMGA